MDFKLRLIHSRVGELFNVTLLLAYVPAKRRELKSFISMWYAYGLKLDALTLLHFNLHLSVNVSFPNTQDCICNHFQSQQRDCPLPISHFPFSAPAIFLRTYLLRSWHVRHELSPCSSAAL